MSQTTKSTKRSKSAAKNKQKANTMPKTQRVSVPVIAGNIYRIPKGPQTKPLQGGGMQVAFSEVVLTISTKTSVSVYEFNLIPTFNSTAGNGSFSWLRGQAQLWAEIIWDDVTFHFQTSAPTTLGGTVAMSPSYDYNDAVPTSIVAAAALGGSVIFPTYGRGGAVVSMPFQPKVPGTSAVTYRVVAHSTFVGLSPAVQNEYSPGRVFIVTPATTVAQEIGQLMVSGKVRFFKRTTLTDKPATTAYRRLEDNGATSLVERTAGLSLSEAK